MKYNLVYLATCNSSYFQGSSLPVVQVLVDGTTTIGDLKEGLISYLTIYETDLDLLEAIAAINRFWEEHGLIDSTLLNPSLEIPVGEEDEWDCYCYFGIEEMDSE